RRAVSSAAGAGPRTAHRRGGIGKAARAGHVKEEAMDGMVTAVSRSPKHTLIKTNEDCIRLLIGLGVEGNAHSGARVKHRSRVARDPTQPNLRQVHLIHAELHDERGRAASPSRPGR